MNLKQVMTTQICNLKPQNTIMDAVKEMQRHNIGAIPICDDSDKIVGMLTDRDIIIRAIAFNKDSNTTPISEIMTTNLITGTPDMSIDRAVEEMAKHQIRRIPVIENERLVGIVALGDIAVRHILDKETIEALSEISEPARPMNMPQQ